MEEQIIQEFLGDQPRAEQLKQWIGALRDRLAGLKEEARRVPAEGPSPALRAKIAEVERQVRALEEEAAITGFVEDSVRVTLAMGAVSDEGGEG